MSESNPSVGVVIPTIGRYTLVPAVASVLAQTYENLRVIVVVDGELSLLDDVVLPSDPRVTVVSNLPEKGVNCARNKGIALCETELVALLDDDDTWAPQKITAQVERFNELRERGAKHAIIACRSTAEDGMGKELGVTPRVLIREGQDVADYLFVRRSVKPGETALGSSMILWDSALSNEVQWDTTLKRHTDWDWILRASRVDGTVVSAVDGSYVRYKAQEPANSMSVARGWQTSTGWVEARSDLLTKRQQADIMLTVSAAIALAYNDFGGAWAICRKAARLRSGSVKAWMFIVAYAGLTAVRGLKR